MIDRTNDESQAWPNNRTNLERGEMECIKTIGPKKEVESYYEPCKYINI